MAVQKQIGMFIVLTIGIVIAIAMIIGSADTVKDSTQTHSYTETVNVASAYIAGAKIDNSFQYTLTNAPTNTGWRANVNGECDVKTITLKNQSGSTLNTGNYTYYPVTGKLNLTNINPMNLSTSSSNTTTVTYNYCTDNYIPGSSNQAIVGLIILFAAIGILIFVITCLIKSGGIYSLTSKVKEVMN